MISPEFTGIPTEVYRALVRVTGDNAAAAQLVRDIPEMARLHEPMQTRSMANFGFYPEPGNPPSAHLIITFRFPFRENLKLHFKPVNQGAKWGWVREEFNKPLTREQLRAALGMIGGPIDLRQLPDGSLERCH